MKSPYLKYITITVYLMLAPLLLFSQTTHEEVISDMTEAHDGINFQCAPNPIASDGYISFGLQRADELTLTLRGKKHVHHEPILLTKAR